MQLASQSGEPDQKISPSIYAALIDSLFESPRSAACGHRLRGHRGGHDRAEDGRKSDLGMCRASHRGRRCPGVRFAAVPARKSTLTAEEAAQWQKRYQIGAMIQAAAIGIWCSITLLSSDDAVAHMICLSVTTGIVAGGAGRAYGRQWIFHLQAVLHVRSDRDRAGVAWHTLLHRDVGRERRISSG